MIGFNRVVVGSECLLTYSYIFLSHPSGLDFPKMTNCSRQVPQPITYTYTLNVTPMFRPRLLLDLSRVPQHALQL